MNDKIFSNNTPLTSFFFVLNIIAMKKFNSTHVLVTLTYYIRSLFLKCFANHFPELYIFLYHMQSHCIHKEWKTYNSACEAFGNFIAFGNSRIEFHKINRRLIDIPRMILWEIYFKTFQSLNKRWTICLTLFAFLFFIHYYY